MVFTKGLNINNFFLFLFFVIFPFGQIVRIGIVHPIDVVVFLGALVVIIKKIKHPLFFKQFKNFLIIAGFSWLLSLFTLRQFEVFYGLLYFFRLFSYFYFFIYVWNFVKGKEENRLLIIKSLMAVSLVSALFGWVQYFTLKSIKPFMVWGWDEHLFRLVGTFMDPTYLGLIICLGLIILTAQYLETNKKKLILVMFFLLISLAFTYSRASYLAFLGSMLVIGFFNKKIKLILCLTVGLIMLIFILPTSGNKILGIFRAFSAVSRLENYVETVDIFKTSPVFGVGYNNICLARSRVLGNADYTSHACSGSDSSLLFVLGTTGIVGFIVFVLLIASIKGVIKRDIYSRIFIASSCALFIHSLFSNSVFYPWILGWMIILLGVVSRSKVKG